MRRLSMRAFIRERVNNGDHVTVGNDVVTAETLDSLSDDDLKRVAFHGYARKVSDLTTGCEQWERDPSRKQKDAR